MLEILTLENHDEKFTISDFLGLNAQCSGGFGVIDYPVSLHIHRNISKWVINPSKFGWSAWSREL